MTDDKSSSAVGPVPKSASQEIASAIRLIRESPDKVVNLMDARSFIFKEMENRSADAESLDEFLEKGEFSLPFAAYDAESALLEYCEHVGELDYLLGAVMYLDMNSVKILKKTGLYDDDYVIMEAEND